MAKTIILVDYNWTLYRSGFRFSEFQIEYKGAILKTGAIYGILELVKMLSTAYEDEKYEIIFCMDGDPKERLELLPSYKESRHAVDPPVEIACARTLKEEPIKILSCVPKVKFLKDPEKEADDLIAMMAFRHLGLGNKVIAFTGDKDMLQLMQFGVKISKQIEDGKPSLLNENYIQMHKDLGVNPNEILYYRALDGDKSDEIEPILGGNKEVKRLLAAKWAETKDKELKNFDSLIKSIEPELSSIFKGKKALENNMTKLKAINKEDLLRNIKLMDLEKYYPIKEAFAKYKETKDKECLKEVKEKYLKNVKVIDFEYDSEDIVKLLKEYDLQRFLAWIRYNNYI